MNLLLHRHRTVLRAVMLAVVGGLVAAEIAGAQVRVPDVPCDPPVARCPENDAACRGIITEQGNVTEPKTGRKFFLDYSCKLRRGQAAIFILNVHGIGGNANWQRHYFPALDYKDKYNLIIATGKSAGTNFTVDADDEYVRGMIEYVAKAFADVDIKFWVAGHSAGGGYSRRWMCADSPLSDRIVGSVSLAGGRVGGTGGPGPGAAIEAGRGRGSLPGSAPGGDAVQGRRGAAAGRAGGAPGQGRGGASAVATCGEFSHIYSTGDIDSLGGNPVPATSTLATSLGCAARVKHRDIVDKKGGHVYDARDREPPLPGWGKEARPGTTEFYEFPKCKDGRVVADLIRLGKGHTEGLEPKMTEEIIKLVAKASK